MRAYEVLQARCTLPRGTLHPEECEVFRPKAEYDQVPHARLTPMEIGWGGFIGLHRSLLIAAHTNGTQLRHILGIRAIPLIS